MTLSENEKAARKVPAKVPPPHKGDAVRQATSKVKAKAQINFRRDVRK